MIRGESHFSQPEKKPAKKEPLFERIKRIGMPLAFLATTGCHPSPVSPSIETQTSQEKQEKMIEIPVRQNVYEEPTMDIFSSIPETEEAKTYQSAACKHLTAHADYQNMKDGKILFGQDVIDQDEENVSHLRPGSLSLQVSVLAHILRPALSFFPTGMKKNGTTVWNLDGMLSKIQKEFGISDSKGVLNEATVRTIDAAWKTQEDMYREANQHWKELCRQYNIESRVKGTTGIALLDAVLVLRTRMRQEHVIRNVPDHLKKYAAGQGNTFLFSKHEQPFYSTLFRDEKSEETTFVHELGHNTFGFGLQGGKSKKIHETFHGGAYGDERENGADLAPFFAAVFGGKKIPASFVDGDMTRGIILRYSDSPMNAFDEISWKTVVAPKQEGIKGKYFMNDGIEKTAKDGFVSGYATSNFMEDEAETFTATLLYPEKEAQARELAGPDSDIAKKFAFMKKVLDKDTFTAWQEQYNF